MFPNPQHIHIQHRTRLLIAGIIGLLMAILATIQIWLPTLGLLTQYTQFSPLARAAILLKLLSPLLSFGVVGGWVLVFLWGAEWIWHFRKSKTISAYLSPSRSDQEEQKGSPSERTSPQQNVRSRETTLDENTRREQPLTASSHSILISTP